MGLRLSGCGAAGKPALRIQARLKYRNTALAGSEKSTTPPLYLCKTTEEVAERAAVGTVARMAGVRTGAWERMDSGVKPAARRIARTVLPVLFAGNRVQCPCCERRFRSFMTHAGRSGARCPSCLALERHRVLWLYLCNGGIGEPPLRVLHIAPEFAIQRRLRNHPGVTYASADLDSASLADIQADVTDLPLPDDDFDVVVCNHVLEHVDDDRRAMSELLRVLKPGGRALMQHPVDEDREATYEDPAITSPEERKAAFGQWDHVRVYGRDFTRRLQEAGFDVDVVDLYAATAPEDRARHGLAREPIYVCTKPAAYRRTSRFHRAQPTSASERAR